MKSWFDLGPPQVKPTLILFFLGKGDKDKELLYSCNLQTTEPLICIPVYQNGILYFDG